MPIRLQAWRCDARHADISCCAQVYPSTMQYLGEGGANVLSIMWFGTLYLLGIDSMFAMVEGALLDMMFRFHGTASH